MKKIKKGIDGNEESMHRLVDDDVSIEKLKKRKKYTADKNGEKSV